MTSKDHHKREKGQVAKKTLPGGEEEAGGKRRPELHLTGGKLGQRRTAKYQISGVGLTGCLEDLREEERCRYKRHNSRFHSS